MSAMKRLLLAAIVGVSAPIAAQSGAGQAYDYWAPQREMIRYGQQAIFMCNGLFTSNRTIEQVFAHELKFLPNPVGTAQGGDYVVDNARKAVAIGKPGGPTPVMRAVYREGLGCVILAPNQNFDVIDTLPKLTAAPLAGNAATIAWPDGDLVQQQALPGGIDAAKLQAASDWAFNRPSPEQDTLSLLVVHKGRIVHERYASGVDLTTRTRTWSAAKSIAATLIGMLVDQGKLKLDQPLPIDWLPRAASATAGGTPAMKDPRSAITLRHVLNMSSGLETIDNGGLEYATGSGMSYWAGTSSIEGARSRALIREPGTSFDYENYDTLLAVYAMKLALGSDAAYHAFPRTALFDKIGMRNTVVGADRFGDFIFSSQVYTNARDLARLGLLYLNNGMWNGTRLISKEWVDFVRAPAPAANNRNKEYGGHFWLPPTTLTDVPRDAYTTNGNRGQYAVVVPSYDLVIVRRGLDYGRQGFDEWALTREVVKAFAPVR